LVPGRYLFLGFWQSTSLTVQDFETAYPAKERETAIENNKERKKERKELATGNLRMLPVCLKTHAIRQTLVSIYQPHVLS